MRSFLYTYIITITILLITNPVKAQLCQGSLGNPIVNITFGSGPNPGQPFSAAATNYIYTSADCPNDGYYAIRNSSTSGCFGSAWHTVTADHTGDPNGYFMLVNASYAPSAFYLDTVHGLCSNTTFEFAAWIANLLKPGYGCQPIIRPDLTFTIEKTDGTILKTFNTGGIPEQNTLTWQQMGFYFVTPPGVQDVVLRIVNNAPGGCGNDLALDDITFRPCGPNIMASINGSPTTSLSFCVGSSHSLTFTGNVLAGLSNPTLQWQQNINGGGWQDIAGATGTTLSQNFPVTKAPGTYQYRLSAVEAGNLTACRTNSPVLSITITPPLTATVSSNTPLCAGSTLLLSVTGNAQYQWTGVNGFTATGPSVSIPDAQPVQSGKYYLQASNAAGCSYSDSISVSINPAPVATAGPDTSICKNERVQLTSSGGTKYQWLPSTGLSADNISNPVATLAETTSYMVIVYNDVACSDTAYVVINVASIPTVNAGPDKSILKGEITTLNGMVNGGNATYNWSPTSYMTDVTSLTPQVSPPADIDYILSATSNARCGIVSDTVHVFVYPGINIPNAFTPNKDGINDTWHISALNAIPVFELSIFNRYGQLIYHTQNNNIPWNGQFKGIDQPSGGYVYLLNIGNGKRILKGMVMLLR